MSVLTSLSAYSQDVYSTVELLDLDAATSVFFAEGRGVSEKEALENARINVLRKIIYEGTDGFNDGMPLAHSSSSASQNPWLKNLFNGKVATYKTFLGGVELVGDFDRDGSTYICKANVIVKHEYLKRQIDMQVNGVSNNSVSNSDQRPTPTHSWSIR
jgi:hypothetical protein